jgi:hypothetical protein
LYEPLDIFKIGCTKNLDRRLKTMNASRTEFDKFFVVNRINTFHYFKLERGLHKLLLKHRLNNEFFQCPLNLIENALREYANLHPFLLHDDRIIQEAENKNLKWYPEKNIFSIQDESNFPGNGVEIFFNEARLIQEILLWISIFDKYNLHRFLHTNHFDGIISYLKNNFQENITSLMEKMTISSSSLSHFPPFPALLPVPDTDTEPEPDRNQTGQRSLDQDFASLKIEKSDISC